MTTFRTLVLALLPSLALGQSPAPPATLAAGDVVPAFSADAVAGGSERIDFKGTTVLLFFLSSCPACHRQIPEWNRAFERSGGAVKIVGILMDREPPGFFSMTPISFPVLRAPAGEFRKTFKVARVPTTLRVGPGGVVEDVAVGPSDGIRIGQLFRSPAK